MFMKSETKRLFATVQSPETEGIVVAMELARSTGI
jgi:hypothetical protein